MTHVAQAVLYTRKMPCRAAKNCHSSCSTAANAAASAQSPNVT